jgi:hypothetical protein
MRKFGSSNVSGMISTGSAPTSPPMGTSMRPPQRSPHRFRSALVAPPSAHTWRKLRPGALSWTSYQCAAPAQLARPPARCICEALGGNWGDCCSSIQMNRSVVWNPSPADSEPDPPPPCAQNMGEFLSPAQKGPDLHLWCRPLQLLQSRCSFYCANAASFRTPRRRPLVGVSGGATRLPAIHCGVLAGSRNCSR